MLARLETMVLMAGVDLPLRAIREQVASAVDLIVHQNRLKDGSRKITNITEVQGMEGDVIVMQDVFAFEQTGVVDGKYPGPPEADRHPAQVRREVRAAGHQPAARPVRLPLLGADHEPRDAGRRAHRCGAVLLIFWGLFGTRRDEVQDTPGALRLRRGAAAEKSEEKRKEAAGPAWSSWPAHAR